MPTPHHSSTTPPGLTSAERPLFRLLFLFFLIVLFHSAGQAHAAEGGPLSGTVPSEEDSDLFAYPPHVARIEGNAEWQLWFFQPGTRSEGVHGKLYIDGKEVLGTDAGETLSTAMGKFVWNGGAEKRQHPWSDSGWLPEGVDVRTLKQSAAYVRPAALVIGHQPFRQQQGNAVLVIWRERSKSAIPFSELRVNGKWLADGKKGERVSCDLGEFVWRELGETGRRHDGWGWIQQK